MTSPEVVTAPFVPQMVTVPDVEILEVGEDWQTSTGVFTFEYEDLVSAIASQDDPAVRTPILKLGHVDPRAGFDGQPAFGKLENLRLTNNDQTLVTDLVGVPQWLAAIMPAAYPRRSIEGDYGYTTQTGNTWRFVLTGLALLGEAYPAITTLEDLKALWGAEVPTLYADSAVEARAMESEVSAERLSGRIVAKKVYPVKWRNRNNPAKASEESPEMAEALEVAASTGPGQGTLRANGEDSHSTSTETTTTGEVDATVAPRQGGSVAASTSVDDIRRAYYDSLPSMQMWWWVRQVLVDPLQLVVDDDESNLYLVDATIQADGSVTFSEPVPIKIEYVAAARSIATRPGQLEASRYDTPEASGARPRATATQEEESGEMELTAESLAALGLEPTATQEEINAAIQALRANVPDGGGDAAPEATPPVEEAPAAEAAAPVAEAAPSVQVPEGMELIDSATAQEMRELVSAARQDREEREVQRRTDDIAAAVQAGKFPRSRVEHYTNLYTADPEGTRTLLASLASGIIPVQERGLASEADPATAEANSYPAAWRANVAAARRNTGSTRVKVGSDDA